MRSFHRRAAVVVAALTGLGLVMSPALASHFRASTSSSSYTTGVVHWQLNEAWRKDSIDQIIGGGGDVEVTSGGSATTATAADPVNTEDLTNPLFDLEHQSTDIDVSSILGTPGLYKAYASSCCRIGGVSNTSGEDSMSQAISFNVRNNGTVDMPPQFNAPSVYTLIPVGGTGSGLALDYRATDPDSTAVTYAYLTSSGDPDYGAAELKCSSLVGGIFRLSASLCQNGDVFTDVYTAGSFWAVKIRATDATGASSETDTLLRVPTIPDPAFDSETSPTIDRGSATFALTLNDEDTIVDQYKVTCTNAAPPNDVHVGTSTGREVTVSGLNPTSTYNCVASATNGLGTGTATTPSPVTTSVFTAQTITFPAVPSTPKGAHATMHATASSDLPVSYTSGTPSICTVSGGVVTALKAGTCSITASQAGDSTTDAATPVTRSFAVTEGASASAALKVATRMTNGSQVRTACVLPDKAVRSCTVAAYGFVKGHRVLLGYGRASTSSTTSRSLGVVVTLNETGRRLARRTHGVQLQLSASITPVGAAVRHTTGRATVFSPNLRPVYFASSSAKLRHRDRAYLVSVRRHMGAVRSITCVGSTDAQAGSTYNDRLARRRALAACRVLAKHRHVAVHVVSLGESHAKYTNKTKSGRAHNRRADVTLGY